MLVMISGLAFLGLFAAVVGSGRKLGFSTVGNSPRTMVSEKSTGRENPLGLVFRQEGVAAAIVMLDGEKDDSARGKLLRNFLREISRREKDPERIAKVFHLLHSTSHRRDPMEFRDEMGHELVMRLELDEILAILEHAKVDEIPSGFLHGLGAKILHHPETVQPVLACFVKMGGKKEAILTKSADMARESGYSALEFDRFVRPHAEGVERQVFGIFLYGYLNSTPDKLLAAIDEAGQLSSPIFRTMLTGYAILHMGRENPVLAHDLFRARRDWFDAQDNDYITRSLIEEVFRLDDRGLARVWAEEIIDPELRRDLRKEIDNPRQRYFLYLRR